MSISNPRRASRTRRSTLLISVDTHLQQLWQAMLEDDETVAARCLAWAQTAASAESAALGAALAFIAEHVASTSREIAPQALPLLARVPLAGDIGNDAAGLLCWSAAVIAESYGLWASAFDSVAEIRGQVESWLVAGEPSVATLAPDVRLIWGCAIAEWCERNGRDAAFAHVAAQVSRRADQAAASAWCRGHWRVAASWHDAAFGRNRDATRVVDEAQALAQAHGLARLAMLVSLQQARRAANVFALDRAAALANAVLTAAPGLHAPLWVADAEEVLCRVALLRGDARAGLAHARRALGWADAARAPASAMVFYEAHEAYALSACGEYDAAIARVQRWSAVTMTPFLHARCAAIVIWLRLIQQEHEGAWDASAIAELAAAVRRLRELEWTSLLPTLPKLLARLWARALAHGIEREWLTSAILQRDLVPPVDGPYVGLEAWPWQICIRVLGTFAVTGKSVQLGNEHHKGAAKPYALLRLIAVQSEHDDISVEHAAETLWPGHAREGRTKALEVTLVRLRKALGSHDAILLQHQRLRLNARRVWLDLHALNRVLSALDAAPVAQLPALWLELFALWRGPLLAQDDAAWIAPARDRVRAQLAAALLAGSKDAEFVARRLRAFSVDPGLARWWPTDALTPVLRPAS